MFDDLGLILYNDKIRRDNINILVLANKQVSCIWLTVSMWISMENSSRCALIALSLKSSCVDYSA